MTIFDVQYPLYSVHYFVTNNISTILNNLRQQTTDYPGPIVFQALPTNVYFYSVDPDDAMEMMLHPIGSQLGADTVTLTEEEMPQHQHSSVLVIDTATPDTTGTGVAIVGTIATVPQNKGTMRHSSATPIKNTAHNNSPPAMSIHAYQRVS